MVATSREQRQKRTGFLLGMTLNELAFLLFFLLILISTHLLNAKNREITRKVRRLDQLEQRLAEKQSLLDATFKKLGLLQNTMDRLHELQPRTHPGELEQQFKRLVESENRARLDNQHLRDQLSALTRLLNANQAQQQAGLETSPLKAVEQLLLQQQKIESQKRDLEAQIQGIQARFKGSGLDHLPCWVNPRNGAIEYVFNIMIIKDRLAIEAAWPSHRDADSKQIPALHALAGRNVSIAQFKRHAEPIFAWSRNQHPECRHFVRVRDHETTSKKAFKTQLRTIETYFYKYLEPDRY